MPGTVDGPSRPTTAKEPPLTLASPIPRPEAQALAFHPVTSSLVLVAAHRSMEPAVIQTRRVASEPELERLAAHRAGLGWWTIRASNPANGVGSRFLDRARRYPGAALRGPNVISARKRNRRAHRPHVLLALRRYLVRRVSSLTGRRGRTLAARVPAASVPFVRDATWTRRRRSCRSRSRWSGEPPKSRFGLSPAT